MLPLVKGFVPFSEQKIQGVFKHFQGHISHFSRTQFSVKKSLDSVCLFYFFHNMIANIILKVLLCLLGWIKLAPKFQYFPAPTAIFKDFQGLECLF